MSDTTSLRLTALDLANKPEFQAKSTEQVVQRANAYLDFLTGDEEKKQPADPGFGERLSAQSISVHAHREGYNQAIEDVLSLRDKFGLSYADTVQVQQVTHQINRLRKN